jgi:hypothetical protein
MDDEPQKPEPKISLPIALFIGIIMVLCDILEFIPIMGDILDIVVGFPLDIYLWLSGINVTYALIEQAVEAIPVAQELPLWTAMWIATVITANNPKLEKAAELAGSLEGKGAAGAAGGVVKEGEAVGKVAQEAARVEKTTEAAKRVEKGVEEVGVGAETAKVAGGASEEAKGAAEETTEEKAVRSLKEREKYKRLEEGSSEEGEEYEPTEEEIAAETAEQKRLSEALGEPQAPLEELQEELLPQEARPGGLQEEKKIEEENGEAVQPKPKKNNVFQIPPRPNQNGKTTQDIVVEDKNKEEGGEDMPLAA